MGSVGIAVVQGGVSGLLAANGILPIASGFANGVVAVGADALDQKFVRGHNVNWGHALLNGASTGLFAYAGGRFGNLLTNGKNQIIRDSYKFVPAIGASYLEKPAQTSVSMTAVNRAMAGTQAIFDGTTTIFNNWMFNLWDTSKSAPTQGNNPGTSIGPITMDWMQVLNSNGWQVTKPAQTPDGNKIYYICFNIEKNYE